MLAFWLTETPISTPLLDHSFSTERRETWFNYDNPYGATIEATYNETQVSPGDLLSLEDGPNVLEIKVTSAKGNNTNTYRITINRALSDLAVVEEFRFYGTDWIEDLKDGGFYSVDIYTDELEDYSTHVEYDNPYGAEVWMKIEGVWVEQRYVEPDEHEEIEFKIISADESKEIEFTCQLNLKDDSKKALIEYLSIHNSGEDDAFGYTRGWTPPLSNPLELTTYALSSDVRWEISQGAKISSVTLKGDVIDEWRYADGGYYFNLAVGDNILLIKVKSRDGEVENDYEINIKRLPPAGALLDTIGLIHLDFWEYEPDSDNYSVTTTRKDTKLYVYNPYAAKILTCTFNGNDYDLTDVITGAIVELSLDNEGLNVFELQVESADGTKSITHQIEVTRNASQQAVITSLEIPEIGYFESSPGLETTVNTKLDSVSIWFDNPYGATITAKLAGESIDLLLEQSDPEGAAYWSGVRDGQLVIGQNEMEITVMPSDPGYAGEPQVYSIVINREALSAKAEIEDLCLDYIEDMVPVGGSEYNLTAETERKTTALSFSNPYNVSYSIKFNDESYEMGEPVSLETGPNNVFTIDVVAEDGVLQGTYTLTITRTPSSNAKIENLYIEGVLRAADPSPEYTLDVFQEYVVLRFDQHYGAEITIRMGEDDYERNQAITLDPDVKNVITITSVSGSGTTETYTLNLTRKASKEKARFETLRFFGIFDVDEEDLNDCTLEFKTSRDGTFVIWNLPHGASVNGDWVNGGWIELNTGLNTFNMVVLAQDGTSSFTYTIKILRENSSETGITDLSAWGVWEDNVYVDSMIGKPDPGELELTTYSDVARLCFDNPYGATIAAKVNGEDAELHCEYAADCYWDENGQSRLVEVSNYLDLSFGEGVESMEVVLTVTLSDGEQSVMYTVTVNKMEAAG